MMTLILLFLGCKPVHTLWKKPLLSGEIAELPESGIVLWCNAEDFSGYAYQIFFFDTASTGQERYLVTDRADTGNVAAHPNKIFISDSIGSPCHWSKESGKWVVKDGFLGFPVDGTLDGREYFEKGQGVCEVSVFDVSGRRLGILGQRSQRPREFQHSFCMTPKNYQTAICDT